MRRTISAGVVLVLAAAVSGSAATLQVPAEYPSIQAGIEAAQNGDTVLVAPGVYYETINFSGKDIVVTSTDPNDPRIVGYTIINADGDGSVVTFERGETSAAKLIGFTITGGFGTFSQDFTDQVNGIKSYAGAGIFCHRASPTIMKNVIARNVGPLNLTGPTEADIKVAFGGGISCFEGSPAILGNTIRNNSAWIGGGILCWFGQPTISDNLILENSAYEGGGVFMFVGSLLNNTIVRNDCGLGDMMGQGTGPGGNVILIIVPEAGATQVCNNIICSAPSGSGVLYQGDLGQALFAYNDVWDNVPGNFSTVDPQTGMIVEGGTADPTGSAGNISEDPLFVNPFSRDYHLMLESPCVNTGDPDSAVPAGRSDIDGQARVYAARIDIGADEYVGYVKPVAVAGFDRHVLEPMQAVTLDGGQSFFYDPCGIRTFQWAQVSGPTVVLDDPNLAQPTFTPAAQGEYVFELVVGDDRYDSAPDQVLVLVAPNQVPVADAGADRAGTLSDQMTLDGTGSYDPDAVDRLTYEWRQVEGPPVDLARADTATPSFATEAEGQWVFELRVSDGFAWSEPSQVRCVALAATFAVPSVAYSSAQPTGVYHPDVSGTKAVYVTAGQVAYDLQIVGLDLMTKKVEILCQGTANTRPRIDGELVTWFGGMFLQNNSGLESSSVFVQNLVTGAQRVLRQRSETSSFSHPAVSGNTVVWIEQVELERGVAGKWADAPYSVCGADLSQFDHPVFFTIATNVGRHDLFSYATFASDYDIVDISGNIVVWEGGGDIYAADISDRNDIRVVTVCDHPARQYDPALSGHVVVWTDERNDRGDIYGADLTDLDSIRLFPVAKGFGVQQQAVVDGPHIVYMDSGSLRGSFRLACLTRQHGVLNAEFPASLVGAMPALDGRTLVWLGSSYTQIGSSSVDFGYSVSDGRVQNVGTGRRYDYVQHAIVEAGAGDGIVLGESLYEEKIDFAGKPITVRSTAPDDPAVVAGTVLSGNGYLASFVAGEGTTSVLAGLTIRGGTQGLCCYNTSPTVTDCVISGNGQAGVRLFGASSPTLARCQIVGNGAAGVEMVISGEGRIVRYSEPPIRNCIIAGNRGDGLHGGKPVLVNSTVVENGRRGLSVVAATVTSSIVYFNDRQADKVQIDSKRATVSYSDVEGGWEGIGNISADPAFVSLGQWTTTADGPGPAAVWVLGDYHLRSQGWRWNVQQQVWVSDEVTSPCIDAGDPAAELSEEPLMAPDGLGGPVGNPCINMGAYGGTAEASLAPPSQ
jgi:beta propeller repeat protein/parallel beta-helix repeat protein